jgi:hypothetical protein
MKGGIMSRRCLCIAVFVLVAVSGCRIVSSSPDNITKISMNPGESIDFKVTLASFADSEEWLINYPGDPLYINALSLGTGSSIRFMATSDNIGEHQIKYNAENSVFIPFIQNTDIGITVKLWEVTRTWNIVVSGVTIDPYKQGLFTANKKAELTANVYPSGDYSYEWYIDGVLSGTARRYSFDPTFEQIGYHTVKVVARSTGKTYTATKSILVPTGELSVPGMINPDVIKQAPDGGYFMLGSTYKLLLPGKETTWVAKFDRAFNLCWEREYVSKEYDGYFNLYPAPDGGCMLTGLNNGWPNYLISRMDENGKIIWSKDIENESFAISPSGEMFYINDKPLNNVWKSSLVKIGTGGETVFDIDVDSLSPGLCISRIFPTEEGGCIVLSHTPEGADLYRLNSSGNVQWVSQMPAETVINILSADPDSFIVAGNSDRTDVPGLVNHGAKDFFAAKMDDSGNVLWQKMFGTSGNEELKQALLKKSGGLILVGMTENEVSYLVSTDSSGNMIQEKTFYNAGLDLFSSDPMKNCSFMDTEDGSLVIVNTYAMETIPYTRYTGRIVLGRLLPDGGISAYAPVFHDDLSYIVKVLHNPYTGGLDIYLSDFYKGYILQTDANGNL